MTTLPIGFKYGVTQAGIKPNRRDMTLIVSEAPCSAAGALTVNAMCAWPVRHARSVLPATDMRAIVVNAGNANALTGPTGPDDERAMAAAVASALSIETRQVLTSSTGSIGVRLPVELAIKAAPALVASLGQDIDAAADAIRTTDLTRKISTRVITLGGKQVTIAAIAKGAGMIHPGMATMLCFATTDAAISPRMLDMAVKAAADETFNTITVDGDMSTNDSIYVLANGMSGAPAIDGPGAAFDAFSAALTEICADLARQIAADGEGATKLLVVDVTGADSRETAREVSRAVAGSNLLKAAVFGDDPVSVSGRALAMLGARIGVRQLPVDVRNVRLTLQGVCVFENFAPTSFDRNALSAKMRQKEVVLALELGAGQASARAMGCDLTYDYVRINADYVGAMKAPEPPAGASRDAGAHSSRRAQVVESLRYIRQFAGKRAVIKYGGAAMVDPELKRSFAEEVVLLQSAGLRPLVVHGGGPEITKMLDRFGHKTEFVNGQRVTGKEDVRVVEMVLTGQVNTELVGMLNTMGGNAIGLSGKDARLLRAHKIQPKAGQPDLGFVGDIDAVNSELLEMLLEKGYTPVVSPVGLADDGGSLNINADLAAAEIAVATGASKLIFLTNVPGILDEKGELITEIKMAELEARLGGSSAIKGGMQVKSTAIMRALQGGVKAVHVVDGRLPHSVVGELFTDRGVGTLITK